jgi:hypothetical protein
MICERFIIYKFSNKTKSPNFNSRTYSFLDTFTTPTMNSESNIGETTKPSLLMKAQSHIITASNILFQQASDISVVSPEISNEDSQ